MYAYLPSTYRGSTRDCTRDWKIIAKPDLRSRAKFSDRRPISGCHSHRRFPLPRRPHLTIRVHPGDHSSGDCASCTGSLDKRARQTDQIVDWVDLTSAFFDRGLHWTEIHPGRPQSRCAAAAMMYDNPPIVTDSVVAARRRCALPEPQVIITTSLLTILGAVKAHGPGDCSRDPSFRREVRNRDFAAGGRRALPHHPEAQANASARPRGFL